jgi:hypothetical protein
MSGDHDDVETAGRGWIVVTIVITVIVIAITTTTTVTTHYP